MSHATRTAAHEPGWLPPQACLARLARSRAGYLACSVRALPTVVPVSVEVRGGQLRLELPDAQLAQRLVGQVVALGVGRRRTLWRRGWNVVARGPVSEVAGVPYAVVLDPQDVEGHLVDRPLP